MWRKETNENGLGIQATDPIEGDKTDVGTTVLADDVCENNITNDAQHMLTVEQISTEASRRHITPLKLTENRDKAEHVPTFRNQGKLTGAKKQTTILKERCKLKKRGIVKKVARYLGSFIETSGNSKTTIRHRINAAKDNFYFLAGFWQATISIDFKSIVFPSCSYWNTYVRNRS